MRAQLIATAIGATSTLVAATGSAIIQNHCNFPVYMWVTDGPTAPPMKTIGAGGSFSQQYQTNPDGGGVSIKLAKDSNDGGEITQFEYTLDGSVWYDISNINGNPFQAEGQSLTSSDNSCPSVKCAPGGSCSSAYYNPDDNSATKSCSADSNTVLSICLGGSGGDAGAEQLEEPKKHHHHHHKEHKDHHHKDHHKEHHHKGHHHHKEAPAPVPTVAPVAPASVANVATTFVTQVVTVTQKKRDASPEPEPTPVHQHIHARHMHGHHFHRHGWSA